jgi:hypothetical protein
MSKIVHYSLLLAIGGLGLVKSCPLKATETTKHQPSMAFLEYLADQVEVNGQLIGPTDMQNLNIKANNVNINQASQKTVLVIDKTEIKNESDQQSEQSNNNKSAFKKIFVAQPLPLSPTKNSTEDKIDE